MRSDCRIRVFTPLLNGMDFKMARLEGESSNSFFSDLEDWESQLKPHEALLSEMDGAMRHLNQDNPGLNENVPK